MLQHWIPIPETTASSAPQVAYSLDSSRGKTGYEQKLHLAMNLSSWAAMLAVQE
jgi:hypothetical protein